MVRKSLYPGVCLLGALSILLPASSRAQQSSAAPAPLGRLVNVDGHLMHIHCMGKGSPTVILEAGTGGFSFDWSLVQPEIARFSRVCSYDRAGSAWSELGPNPRTIRQRVYELHTLLTKAGISGPFLLVGHSGGGYIVRQYQARYPEEVVGMVLAECGHEDGLAFIDGKIVRVRELSKGRPIPAVRTEMSVSERTIAPDVLKKLEQAQQLIGRPANDPPYDRLPPNIQKIRLWALGQPKHWLADYNPFEGEEMAAMSAERRKRDYPLGDLPLIVLHREEAGYKPIPGPVTPEQVKQLEVERLAHNQDLVRLSRNSAHVIASNSSHDIQLDRPELVIEAIRQVYEAARHHTSVQHAEVVK
jgi:pimeloyl-ACP methyl ester carboxylesterase